MYDTRKMSNAEFRNLIENRLSQNTTETRILITPEQADIVLEYVKDNRPVSPSKVKQYAQRMKNWAYTKEPIIFSNKGRLLNGQHRMHACIRANSPFVVDIAFGADDDSFDKMDSGKIRNAPDVFAMHNVENHKLVPSATKVILSYKKYGRISPKGGIVNQTNDETYRTYLSYEDLLQESVLLWERHKATGTTIIKSGLFMGLYYLCAEIDKPSADEFFGRLAENRLPDSPNSPVRVLYNRLLQNKKSRGKKYADDHVSAWVIKAWNAERKSRTIEKLNYLPKSESFPEIK